MFRPRVFIALLSENERPECDHAPPNPFSPFPLPGSARASSSASGGLAVLKNSGEHWGWGVPPYPPISTMSNARFFACDRGAVRVEYPALIARFPAFTKMSRLPGSPDRVGGSPPPSRNFCAGGVCPPPPPGLPGAEGRTKCKRRISPKKNSLVLQGMPIW